MAAPRRRNKPKPVTARAIHPNAGIQAWYRRKLQELVNEMHQSMLYWTTSAWKKEGLPMAMDAGPTRTLRRMLQQRADYWQKRFDEIAPALAEKFARDASQYYDKTAQQVFAEKGWTVKFKPTRAQKAAYEAVAQENINLIKSISSEYLTDVQGDVWRNVLEGYDMGRLSQQLTKRYGVTESRAALIARDQCAKANAAFEEQRRTELGIVEAQWMHSAGGKEPRPSHVKASGTRFNVKKGCFIEGEWIKPGQKINCRCVSKSIIPGL